VLEDSVIIVRIHVPLNFFLVGWRGTLMF